MRKSGYAIAMTVLCLVILTCLMAGCAGFGPGIPGTGPGGAGTGGSGGSGTGVGPSGGGQGEGAGSGGSGSGSGGGGDLPPGGGQIPLSDLKMTPMYTYFTVNCNYHDQRATDRYIYSTEDITLTGEIPIEMIREYNDPRTSNIYETIAAGMNLKYSFQEFCHPDDEFCKPCKETYEGPASGAAVITRAPSGGMSNWMASFSFGGPEEYNMWCSGFDPNGNYCPPRYPSYSDTGEIRIATPPVQGTCYPGESQDILRLGIGATPCNIKEAPFVLRDGEVITQKRKYDIVGNSYSSVDATYTFHISAQ